MEGIAKIQSNFYKLNIRVEACLVKCIVYKQPQSPNLDHTDNFIASSADRKAKIQIPSQVFIWDADMKA